MHQLKKKLHQPQRRAFQTQKDTTVKKYFELKQLLNCSPYCLSHYCLVYFVNKNRLYCIDACIDEVNTVLKTFNFPTMVDRATSSFQQHPASHLYSYTHSHLVAVKISKVINYLPHSSSARVAEG